MLCEECSRDLVLAIDSRKEDPNLVPFRGYIDLIASNPDDVSLPNRTLPVYLLNGRDDASGTHEAANLPKQAALRRRLNMLKRLVDAVPRVLVFVSSGSQSSVESICELWSEGFRSRLVFVSDSQSEIETLDKEFRARFEISAITVCVLSPADFSAGLCNAARPTFEPTRLVGGEVRSSVEAG